MLGNGLILFHKTDKVFGVCSLKVKLTEKNMSVLRFVLTFLLVTETINF